MGKTVGAVIPFAPPGTGAEGSPLPLVGVESARIRSLMKPLWGICRVTGRHPRRGRVKDELRESFWLVDGRGNERLKHKAILD